MSAADRAALTRSLLERGLEVSCRQARRHVGATDATMPIAASRRRATLPAQPASGRLEAVVPGHRLLALHQLHAVPELLPVRRLRRLGRQQDPGAEPGQLQDRLPGLFARLSRKSRSCSRSTATARSTATRCSADDIRREAMKVDISALLGGDIYSMLRDRSAKAKSRFSKERDDDRALKERQNCLIEAAAADARHPGGSAGRAAVARTRSAPRRKRRGAGARPRVRRANVRRRRR